MDQDASMKDGNNAAASAAAAALVVPDGTRTSSLSSMAPHHLAPDHDPSADLMQQTATPYTPQRRRPRHHDEDNSSSSSVPSASPSASAFSTPEREGSQIQLSDFSISPVSCDTDSLTFSNLDNNSNNAGPLMAAADKEMTAYYASRNILDGVAGSAVSTPSRSEHDGDDSLLQDYQVERQTDTQDHQHHADTLIASSQTSVSTHETEDNDDDDVNMTRSTGEPPSLSGPVNSTSSTRRERLMNKARHRYNHNDGGTSSSQSPSRRRSATVSPVRTRVQSSVSPPASRSSSVSRGDRRTPVNDAVPETVDEEETPAEVVVESPDKKPSLLSRLVQASPLRARRLTTQSSHDSSSTPLRSRTPDESSTTDLAENAISPPAGERSQPTVAVDTNSNNRGTPPPSRSSPARAGHSGVVGYYDSLRMTATPERARSSPSRVRDNDDDSATAQPPLAPPTSPTLSPSLLKPALRRPNSPPSLSSPAPVRFAAHVSVRTPRNTETPDSTSKQSQSSSSDSSEGSHTTNSLSKDSTVTETLNSTMMQTAANTVRNALPPARGKSTSPSSSRRSPSRERASSPLARSKSPLVAPMMLVTPPPPPAAADDTPKTANCSDRKTNVSGTSTDVSDGSPARHADWSKKAVATMAHSVSMALSKLKTFADEVPSMVDTSLESLYHDKESEYHTTLDIAEPDVLDLNELARELRQGGRHEGRKADNDSEDMQTIQAKFSRSIDSVGKPKPPVLQSNPISAHLKKPKAMKAAATAPADSAKPGQLPPITPRKRKELFEAARSSKNPSAENKDSKFDSAASSAVAAAAPVTTAPFLSLTNNPKTPVGATRQITPLERMRSWHGDSNDAPGALFSSTKPEMSHRLTDEDEIMVQKQRRRKEKATMAEMTPTAKRRQHENVRKGKSRAATRSNSETKDSKTGSKISKENGSGGSGGSSKQRPARVARRDRPRRQRPPPQQTEMLRCSPSKIQQMIDKILEGRCGELDDIWTEMYEDDPVDDLSSEGDEDFEEESESLEQTTYNSDAESESKTTTSETDGTEMTPDQSHGLPFASALTAQRSIIDAHNLLATPRDMMSPAEVRRMAVLEAHIPASENEETEDDLEDEDDLRDAAHPKQPSPPPLSSEAQMIRPFFDEACFEEEVHKKQATRKSSLARAVSPSTSDKKRSFSKARGAKQPSSVQTAPHNRTPASSPSAVARLKQLTSPKLLKPPKTLSSPILSPTQRTQPVTLRQLLQPNVHSDVWCAKFEDNFEKQPAPSDEVPQKPSYIKSFIANMTDWGMTMQLHRKGRRRIKKATRVTVQLCSGGRDDKAVTSPFLAPCLQMSTTEGTILFAANLFQILYLEKATINQLLDYPNAVPGQGVLVRLATDELLLEAPDEQAATRLVHGMKWLVARLSFNLIIGNIDVSCELLDVDHLFDNNDHKEDEFTAFSDVRLRQTRHMRVVNDLANSLVDTSVQTLGKR